MCSRSHGGFRSGFMGRVVVIEREVYRERRATVKLRIL